MVFAGAMETLFAVTLTLGGALLFEEWQAQRHSEGKAHDSKLTWELFVAGLAFWIYGKSSGHAGAGASGMTLAGAALCREIFHIVSFGQSEEKRKPGTEEQKHGGILAQTHFNGLIQRKDNGLYEVNIYELASAISRKKKRASRHSSIAASPDDVHETKQLETEPSKTSADIASKSLCTVSPSSIPVKTILQEYVLPWVREQAHLEGITCLLKILDAGSDAPSVILEQEQMSQGEPYNVQYEALHRVSLGEHTLHAVQEGFFLVQGSFGETGLYTVWPRLVICIIAHDLGKIPEKRLDYGYSKLDHPGISADIIRECLGKNSGITEECSQIVLYHHGGTPSDFPYTQGLEMLKEADARARRKELEKALSHLKPWTEIPLEDVARELANAILGIIRSGDMARDLFYLNPDQGRMYVNPDILLEVLQTIARDTYLWPEIYSPDSRMSENALRQFMNQKMKPSGWLTDNFPRESFAWFKIDKLGKVTGPRPFAEMSFMKFVQAAGIKPSEILVPWRNSFIGKCRVLKK